MAARWTEEEINLLREYADEGLSSQQTANKLNRTTKSVLVKASRLKIKFSSIPSKWSNEEIRQLADYASQGLDQHTVAELLGRTHGATNNMASKLKIRFSSIKPWTEEELEKLKQFAKAKLSCREVANKLGRTYEAVERKAGIEKINFNSSKSNKKSSSNLYLLEIKTNIKTFLKVGYACDIKARISNIAKSIRAAGTEVSISLLDSIEDTGVNIWNMEQSIHKHFRDIGVLTPTTLPHTFDGYTECYGLKDKPMLLSIFTEYKHS